MVKLFTNRHLFNIYIMSLEFQVSGVFFFLLNFKREGEKKKESLVKESLYSRYEVSDNRN